MSISSLFRGVGRIRCSIVIAVGVLLVAPIVSAGPSLWLYPKDAGPREGGHVVPPGTFTLVIENRSKDSEANTAHEVELVIAVADPAAVNVLEVVYDGETISLDPTSWEEGIPALPCSGKPMSRHGVYPAAYLAVLLDDLAGGEVVEIEVMVEGEDNLRVHFDAMAFGLKTTGQGERCFDISNPSGHDVTVANRRGGQDACGRVSISKTADPRYVDFGENVTFVIEVLNEGTCDLTELILTDFIPVVEDENGDSHPAFQWIGGTDPTPSEIDEDGYWLKWTLGTPLGVGESAVVQLVVEFNQLAADGQRVVNRACISAAELRTPRCTSAGVMVGNPYGEDGPAGPGFWCHAARWVIEDRPKVPVTGEELLAWLEEVDFDSAVFSEFYPIFVSGDPEASLLATAYLLCTPQLAEGAADRLARHLLTLWLNVVSGRLDPTLTLGQLCGGDEILPDDTNLDMTVGALRDEVDAGLAAGADDEQLTFWSETVDAVNNSRVPGEFGCNAPRSVSGRQRGNHGMPGAKLNMSKVKD
jgi:uncharacterized repeat protein (TIGR01451 family)